MKILLFSEEYQKTTTGMFSVWSNWMKFSPKHHAIQVLLNREHWASTKSEIANYFDQPVSFDRLPLNIFEQKILTVAWLQTPLLPLKILRKILFLITSFLTTPVYLLTLIFLLKGPEYDALIVHNGGWPGGKLCHLILVAGWMTGIEKRLLVVHGNPLIRNTFGGRMQKLFWRIQAKITQITSTQIIAVSDALCAALKDHILPNGLTPSRIYNGIALDQFKKSMPRTRRKNSLFRIGYIGTLHPLKDPEVLIRAFLKMKYRKCILSLLGPGHDAYVKELKDLAAPRIGSIEFRGFDRDIKTYIDSIDVLVVPSRFETFGMVILEGMRQSIPVICSDSGGMKEIVLHNKTGFVFSTGSNTELANYLDILAQNPTMCRNMGVAGYARFRKFFSVEKMVDAYEYALSA
jgi:teichuronic acid biosynthesis glycosyltransferase TuaC